MPGNSRVLVVKRNFSPHSNSAALRQALFDISLNKLGVLFGYILQKRHSFQNQLSPLRLASPEVRF